MKSLLFILFLLLVGCAAKPGKMHARVATIGPGLQTWCLPVSLAQTLGYYQDEGLDVALEALPSAGKTMQALVGGSVDIAAIVYFQTIQMAAEGRRLRAFFICDQRSNVTLVVAPKARDRIRRIEELKGAMLGVASLGSPSHAWAGYILSKHGVSPADITAVGIATGAAGIAAIESGRVDAAVLAGGDHLRLLRRNPTLRILLDGSTPEGMRETHGQDVSAVGTLTAMQFWLDHNPDTARKFAHALQRTLHWMVTHRPEEIYQHLPENVRSPDASADIEVIRWSLPALTADGKMPPGAPEAVKHFLDATSDKVRDSKIDLASTWTNEYLADTK